jgi:hypothetical protein
MGAETLRGHERTFDGLIEHTTAAATHDQQSKTDELNRALTEF